MTFRGQVAVVVTAAAVIPLLVLAFGVRREMTQRLSHQADQQVETEIGRAREVMSQASASVESTLTRLADRLIGENRFRLAVSSGDLTTPWLREWAETMLASSSLAALELVSDSGRILSSGHFRNEFGRSHWGLPEALEPGSGDATVARLRTPAGAVDVLARSHPIDVAGRRFHLVGGSTIDRALILPLSSSGLRAEIRTERSVSEGDRRETVAEFPLRLVIPGDSTIERPALLVLSRDVGALIELRRSVDRWFLVAGAVMLLFAAGLSLWLASRVTRPLAGLAVKTGQVDLDRLEQSFDIGRDDEIGALARLLDTLMGRLRLSAARLRDAERRAATGDLARQINHDVKNGLAPIRHVLQHLDDVARRQPAELAAVFQERQKTLEASVAYLEGLARNYARLSPSLDRIETDPNSVLREVARSLPFPPGKIELKLADPVPAVRADAVALRRILENLGMNAVDAAAETNGMVSLATDRVSRDSLDWVRFTVTDTGAGMNQEALAKAFDDFYTTKPGGTGLGLSVVRRLVSDLGGTLRVETAPGQGSRFIVELPPAGAL